jgi:diacylglycerol kinase (ATP)
LPTGFPAGTPAAKATLDPNLAKITPNPNASKTAPDAKNAAQAPLDPNALKAPLPPMKRLLNATGYSMEGFASALKHEQAFRQEMILAVVLIPVAALLPVDYLGKALMIGSVLLVLIVELLNSAVEWCVDLAAQQQRHAFAKRAKDMGSAAVFLSLVNCLIMWVLAITQAVAAGRF